jgi:hypothetical protein
VPQTISSSSENGKTAQEVRRSFGVIDGPVRLAYSGFFSKLALIDFYRLISGTTLNHVTRHL